MSQVNSGTKHSGNVTSESPRPAQAASERRDVFFLMVMHPLRGWIRVGKPYVSRKVARSWVAFTRKVWHGLPVHVERFTAEYINGEMSSESRRVLDQKFNMYVDEDEAAHNVPERDAEITTVG